MSLLNLSRKLRDEYCLGHNIQSIFSLPLRDALRCASNFLHKPLKLVSIFCGQKGMEPQFLSLYKRSLIGGKNNEVKGSSFHRSIKFLYVCVSVVLWINFFSTHKVDALSGRSYSYKQLKNLTQRFSSALAKRGFKKGDVLAMFLPNVIEYPIIFYGTAFLGGTVSTVNPSYSSQELARQLRVSEAKYIVTIPPLAEKVKDAAALEGIRSVIVVGEAPGCEPLSSFFADDGTAFPEFVSINPKKDIVALPFSSGTTGLSKGVMITHHNLVAGLSVLFSCDVFPADSAVLTLLPFYHIYALLCMMGGCLQLGCKVVVMMRFEPDSFLKVMQDYKVGFRLLQ